MTEKFIQFLENFSSETLEELESIYHEDISYVDPINKGQGIKHLRLITVSYTHLRAHET